MESDVGGLARNGQALGGQKVVIVCFAIRTAWSHRGGMELRRSCRYSEIMKSQFRLTGIVLAGQPGQVLKVSKVFMPEGRIQTAVFQRFHRGIKKPMPSNEAPTGAYDPGVLPIRDEIDPETWGKRPIIRPSLATLSRPGVPKALRREPGGRVHPSQGAAELARE